MPEPILFDRRSVLRGSSAAALFAALPACVSSQAARSRQRWPAVEALLAGLIAEGSFPGMLVAMSFGGAEPHYVAAGRLAFDSSRPVDENSLWRIKSMTKQVTGVAMMQLVEDGRLSLDQPIGDILPALRQLRVAIDPQAGLESRPAQRPVTIRHLITHSSGLSYWIPSSGEGLLPRLYRERGITPGNYYPSRLNQPGYGPQANGLAQMVERLAGLPLAFEPGSHWLYSIGPDVIGAAIERITGSFADFLRERLFAPLDMRSTGFQVAGRDSGRLTSNYAVTAAGPELLDAGTSSVFLEPPRIEAGGAGLVASARDFMRFAAMLLGGGALGGARVIRPETARQAVSNLLPSGVSASSRMGARGFGAGGAVVLPGDDSILGGAGSYGGAGAAGTAWAMDPARQAILLLLTQHMPPNDLFRIQREIAAAIGNHLR